MEQMELDVNLVINNLLEEIARLQKDNAILMAQLQQRAIAEQQEQENK